MLAVVGGHSFQDYAAYRDAALAALPGLGLELGVDVVAARHGRTRPSSAAGTRRRRAGLPLGQGGLGARRAGGAEHRLCRSWRATWPVFGEYLTDGCDALLPLVGDSAALAVALRRVATDGALRDRLRAGGRIVVDRFTWAASAERHREIYADVRAARP